MGFSTFSSARFCLRCFEFLLLHAYTHLVFCPHENWPFIIIKCLLWSLVMLFWLLPTFSDTDMAPVLQACWSHRSSSRPFSRGFDLGSWGLAPGAASELTDASRGSLQENVGLAAVGVSPGLGPWGRGCPMSLSVHTEVLQVHGVGVLAAAGGSLGLQQSTSPRPDAGSSGLYFCRMFLLGVAC